MAVKKILKKEPANINLPVPQADPELSASAKRLLVQAQALTVTTAEEYEEAGEVLLRLNMREKEVEAKKKELWDPLAKLTKSVQALFNPPLKVLDTAKKLVASKMGIYAQEQANIALERQRLADEEAEEAREKLLAKAEKASDDGNHARAVILEARADSVQAATIEVETPQVPGLKLVPRWLFEVTDESLVPRKFLMVDERLVRAEVNAQQANAKIPGVRVWSTLKPQG